MYNFVLHSHLHMNLWFQVIVETDEDQDDHHFDRNARQEKSSFVFCFIFDFSKFQLLEPLSRDPSIDYYEFVLEINRKLIWKIIVNM